MADRGRAKEKREEEEEEEEEEERRPSNENENENDTPSGFLAVGLQLGAEREERNKWLAGRKKERIFLSLARSQGSL